jgi:hypothetical protein
MAVTHHRKPPPSENHTDIGDLLQILVFHKALTREQAERVRRQARGSAMPVVQIIVKLGLATETQIGQALAAFAGRDS